MSHIKVAFVTGCSNGLGFSIATKLIQSGYIVYATMKSLENKKKLEKSCNHSKNLFILPLDLTDYAAIHKAVDEVLSRHKQIDVIIFNAAATLIGPPDSASSFEVEHLFKVNVFSIVKLAQLFLPQMRRQKRGNLIFIGSISGIESSGYLGIYSATKFAIEAIASSWASILHKWSIKTTIIEPGAMNTNLPHSATIGSYYDLFPENPYKEFNQNALNFLKDCLQKGEDPNKVAELVLEILNTPEPHLRYQTCDFSRNLVQRHLCDPHSKEWLEEHRQFIDSFFSESS